MSTRALVLGSGGLTGVAWEAGVLQGLGEAGILVDGWDLVIGTSAGAFVGARLLVQGSPTPLYVAQLETDVAALEAALATAIGGFAVRLIRMARHPRLEGLQRRGAIPLVLRSVSIDAAHHGLGEFRKLPVVARSRRPGAVPTTADLAALGSVARGVRRAEAPWVDYWSRALSPVDAWPASPHVAVAVDIADGSRRTIGREDGVPLEVAIAASTAVPGLLPPITIGGHRHMDGGAGSQTNADLALGHDAVLVLAPVDRGTLAAEVDSLRASGARVDVIVPGDEASAAMAEDLGRLDPLRIAPAARAGRDDGLAAGRSLVTELRSPEEGRPEG